MLVVMQLFQDILRQGDAVRSATEFAGRIYILKRKHHLNEHTMQTPDATQHTHSGAFALFLSSILPSTSSIHFILIAVTTLLEILYN